MIKHIYVLTFILKLLFLLQDIYGWYSEIIIFQEHIPLKFSSEKQKTYQISHLLKSLK